MTVSTHSRLLEYQGWLTLPNTVSQAKCERLIDCVSSMPASQAGEREILREPWARDLGNELAHTLRAEALLPQGHRAVQCTFFNKSIEHNWLVPYHQDLSIPVAKRFDSPLYTGWSCKDETWFVQPPEEVLHSLLAVRVHLDPCTTDDGALRVLSGSHLRGRVRLDTLPDIKAQHVEAICEVEPGGALLMRPLLLHASAKSRRPSPRRVLHFVFGPPLLPGGLSWAHARWPSLSGSQDNGGHKSGAHPTVHSDHAD